MWSCEETHSPLEIESQNLGLEALNPMVEDGKNTREVYGNFILSIYLFIFITAFATSRLRLSILISPVYLIP